MRVKFSTFKIRPSVKMVDQQTGDVQQFYFVVSIETYEARLPIGLRFHSRLVVRTQFGEAFFDSIPHVQNVTNHQGGVETSKRSPGYFQCKAHMSLWATAAE